MLHRIPIITKDGEQVCISGAPEALEALAHALLAKAKIGDKLPCILNDGYNSPIEILTADEVLKKIQANRAAI